MVESTRPTSAFRCLLTLALLSAGVAAPFRSHALGRALLFASGDASMHGTVVRVRALSGGGVTCGFRAVAGVSGGGGGSAADDTPAARRAIPSSQVLIPPSSTGAFPVAPLHPPLRC